MLQSYVLTTVIWRCVVLLLLMIQVMLLARSKWDFSYIKDESFFKSLDGVIGVLSASLGWVAMCMPFVIAEAISGVGPGLTLQVYQSQYFHLSQHTECG